MPELVSFKQFLSAPCIVCSEWPERILDDIGEDKLITSSQTGSHLGLCSSVCVWSHIQK